MKMQYPLIGFMAVLLLTGCMGDRSIEGNGTEEDSAVNTFQSGSKYRIVTPMMELKEAVEDIMGDNYWPDTMLSEEEFAERTGISDNMYENFMAEYQRSEAGVDMMILIQAKEDCAEDVESYLNDYRELLLRIYENQPLNEAKVTASRIEVIQNYVCYVQLGADLSGLKDAGHEEMTAYCLQENERALDIMEKKIMSWEE